MNAADRDTSHYVIVTDAERQAITRARASAPDDPLVDVVTEVLMTAWLIEAGAGRFPEDARGRRVRLLAELLLDLAAGPDRDGGVA